MLAWSVKTRRAPSRHCRDARVYGHTTTAMHDNEYTSRDQYASFLAFPLLVDFHRILPARAFSFALSKTEQDSENKGRGGKHLEEYTSRDSNNRQHGLQSTVKTTAVNYCCYIYIYIFNTCSHDTYVPCLVSPPRYMPRYLSSRAIVQRSV